MEKETKVIVRNLPESWTTDYLVNYLEVTSGQQLLVAEEGIQVFLGVTHTALVTLEEPVTARTVQHTEELLSRSPFQGTRVLQLETVPSRTSGLLIHYTDPSVSRDHIDFYFDDPQLSGCGDGCVEECRIFRDLMLAIVRFSSAKALEGVVAKGNHRLQNNGEVLKVEPWYESFHGPLLTERLTAQSTPCHSQSGAHRPADQGDFRQYSSPAAHGNPRKPACHNVLSTEQNPVTVPLVSYSFESDRSRAPPVYAIPQPTGPPAALNITGRGESQEIEQLKRENEKLRQTLATREAKEREERERFQQQAWRQQEERRRTEQLWADQETERHQMEMHHVWAEEEAKKVRIEREVVQKSMEPNYAGMGKVWAEESHSLCNQPARTMSVKSENEKRTRQTVVRIPMPCYKYSLLERFTDPCTACQLTYLEHKEELMLCGSEEDCETENLRIAKYLHGLAEAAMPLPEPVARILDTPGGRGYLADLLLNYLECSAHVQDGHVLCAALSQGELQEFMTQLQGNILRKTCQVPSALAKSVQFQALKMKLEMDHMVVVTDPVDPSEDVQLDGFKGSVELAFQDLVQFTNLNRCGSKKFVIPGVLQGKACRHWFSEELDEVKQLILRNNGEIESETKEGEYVLDFQCRQEVLAEVISKLESISSRIVSGTIDLNREFPEDFERTLLINGLHDVGAGVFCRRLAEKLQESGVQGAAHIVLPENCPLPPFRVDPAEGHQRRHSRSREQPSKGRYGQRQEKQDRNGQSQEKPPKPKVNNQSAGSFLNLAALMAMRPPAPERGRRGFRRGGRAPKPAKDPSALHHSVSVGGTQVTVKLGDLTEEKVAAAVNVLGPDLNPKVTSLGAAFLAKWPPLSKALTSNNGGKGGSGQGWHVVVTPTDRRSLPMSTLFHAVLHHRRSSADVGETVREVVLQILQTAVTQQLKSVAFPPLGVARKFGFGRYATAVAMISAFQQFLQENPGQLEAITVVVYKDPSTAGKFIKVMKRSLHRRSGAASASAGRMTGGSDTEDSSDSTDGSTSQEEAETERAITEEKFEAAVCTTRQGDQQTVKALLLKELSVTFLWHETLRGGPAQDFLALPPQSLQELADSATEKKVMLSTRWNGKGLRLSGQRDRVLEMRSLILTKVSGGGAGGSQQEAAKRHRLHLPQNTDRLPGYWKVCQGNPSMTYDRAIESWKRRGLRLNAVSGEVHRAVEQLVMATWELSKVGHGADAKNLNHSKIQVVKVERLENPRLWQKYSHKREELFDTLMFHHQGNKPAACRPVESLPSSTGPVRTTQNIARDGPLNRHIFHQVNEHYLFHGTKAEVLNKICCEGLDDRLTGKAMLGRGVYLTESPTKADQYADSKTARVQTGQELKILLVRVLLGEPYLHNGNPETFLRPPCSVCRKRARECQCTEKPCHGSVVFDSTKIFREFVVYDRDVCYPEYIITYVRV